jgi:hypothetical protein
MGIDNVIVDKVMVELDGPRELIFTLRSFAMLSKKYGSVQEALNRFYSVEEITSLTEEYIQVLCDMAHAGFAHYGKDFPPEQIDEVITAKNVFALIAKIREAISLSVPKADEANPPIAV